MPSTAVTRSSGIRRSSRRSSCSGEKPNCWIFVGAGHHDRLAAALAGELAAEVASWPLPVVDRDARLRADDMIPGTPMLRSSEAVKSRPRCR
jgi:hypothetical protein